MACTYCERIKVAGPVIGMFARKLETPGLYTRDAASCSYHSYLCANLDVDIILIATHTMRPVLGSCHNVSGLEQLPMTSHIPIVSCTTCCKLLVDSNIVPLTSCHEGEQCCTFPGVIIKLEAML